MIEMLETGSPKIVGFKMSGKLHAEDYKQFVPVIEAVIANEGKVRMFAHFEDFHGWDLHASWDDFSFGLKHYHDYERIVMVGDKAWEKWMALLCKPFTGAKVKYFDASQIDQAWQWIKEDMPVAVGSGDE